MTEQQQRQLDLLNSMTDEVISDLEEQGALVLAEARGKLTAIETQIALAKSLREDVTKKIQEEA